MGNWNSSRTTQRYCISLWRHFRLWVCHDVLRWVNFRPKKICVCNFWLTGTYIPCNRSHPLIDGRTDGLGHWWLAPILALSSLSCLAVKMPPAYSRMSRPDSTGTTPPGYRTPRGDHPGRRHYDDDARRDSEGVEIRDSNMESAFRQSLDAVRPNALCFREAVVHTHPTKLRRHHFDEDYAEAMHDPIFEVASRHLSYFFRHSWLTHSDGSLTLDARLNHMKEIDTDNISQAMRSRIPAIKSMLPLAHICCNSNKSRVMLGFLTRQEYKPGTMANPTSWFTPAMFQHTDERSAQADMFEDVDLGVFFLRLKSGDSNRSTVDHAELQPSRFKNRYLVHGTNERILIRSDNADSLQAAPEAAGRTCISPWTAH